MPLCLRTSTYFTGIAGEIGSGFGLGFVEDCARDALCMPSVERAAVSAKIAAQTDVASLPGVREKRRQDAGATGALDTLFPSLIACGQRPKAPSVEIGCERSLASVRSRWMVAPALAPAPARFDSHRGRPRCCP